MIIYNANVKGNLCCIEIDGGKIKSVTKNTGKGDINAMGLRVIPGLIDVHTHGILGMDTMDADFENMCKCYAKCGTTSFLPTTMTMSYDDLKRVDSAKTDFCGANILGFHFEGPFISKNKKGAQNEEYIKNPCYEEFKKFKNVKMITVAPELPGAMEFIKKVSQECVVSIGHTDCDYETAIAAIENGANCLTHTYNAMPPFLHRSAGPIGAGFEKHIYAQLICDGVHVSKPAVLAIFRLFGKERTVLISDSIRPAGLKDGTYESGGLKVTLQNGVIRLQDGTVAGGFSTLLNGVKTAVSFGIPFDDAVAAASTTPAELLNIKKGKIEAGYDADLLILNNDLSVNTVIIDGKVFS